jgi:hypothetical protein
MKPLLWGILWLAGLGALWGLLMLLLDLLQWAETAEMWDGEY